MEQHKLEALNRMAEERNTAARVKSLVSYKPLNIIYSSGVLPSILWAAKKSIKPLKNDATILSYLEKNTRLRNNVPISFPEIEELSRLRGVRLGQIESFLKDITENKSSNLSLARFIERYIQWSKKDLTDKLIDEIIDELKNSGYITYEDENEYFDGAYIRELLEKHRNINLWLGKNPEKNPVRNKAQVLFTLPEIHFFLILDDYHTKKTSFSTKEEFKNDFESKINVSTLSIFPKNADNILLREKLLKLFNTLNTDKILEKKEGSDKYTVVEINWEPLFKEGDAPITPKHIACADFSSDQTYISYHLHHAMYISKDILVEQLANKKTTGEMDYFISLKTMVDFLKYCRGVNSEIFIIPYTDPYPADVLRRRALWTLGRFPYYSAKSENCESMPSWVFENNTGDPSMCVPNKLAAIPWAGRGVFFSQYMKETYNPINKAIRGGKTRKYRTTKRKTRRNKNLSA